MRTSVVNAFAKVYYNLLKQEIINSGIFDEDVYHDTYVVLYSALDAPLVPEMFKTVYRRLLRRELSRSLKMIYPLSDTYFQFIPGRDEDNSATGNKYDFRVTAIEVKEYANICLPPSEYKLFFLRFIKGLTLKQTGEYIGRSPSYVSRHTENIKKSLSNHFNQSAI